MLKKEKRVKIAIIGAGTAGLTAWREVAKHTQDFTLIGGGELGTTCARVGCMPSKLLIQAASDFHRRKVFDELGIEGAEHLKVNSSKVFERVRKLRDRFVSGVMKGMDSLGDHFLRGMARFVEPNVLEVDQQKIVADKIIVAAGTRPVVPEAWKELEGRLLTSDDIFELHELPRSLAVLGAGVIGLELGLACAQLGSQVRVFDAKDRLDLLKDPIVHAEALEIFSQELEQIQLGQAAQPKDVDFAEKVLLAVGRRPNFDQLQFENSGFALNEQGFPEFDPSTQLVQGSTHLFVAGDISGDRQLLHEAADEGRIAGFNATQAEPKCFQRRCPMSIVFTEPQIGVVGTRWSNSAAVEMIRGEISFESQGRALVMAKNRGRLHIYAEKASGRLLGAEMICPQAEHLSHLLAWAIQERKTAFELLQMPVYHPVLEEGLRTALRELSRKTKSQPARMELPSCEKLDHE